MNIRIELKYAMLITLLMLLWLSAEFMVGLQDTFIAWYPYLSTLSWIIPIGMTRQALVAKRDQLAGQLPLSKALTTGLVLTGLTAVLSVPVQLIFHYLINPDFFEAMIHYAVTYGHRNPEQAAGFYNLPASLIQHFLGSLFIGTLIAVTAAYLMQTKKQ